MSKGGSIFKNRKFRFSLETTVLAILAATICYFLGHWQYKRYLGKQEFFKNVEEQKARGRHPFESDLQDWEPQHHALVETSGYFDYAETVFLINRSLGNLPGVKVITPFILNGAMGKELALLVDRGFLPYELYEGNWLAEHQDRGILTLQGIVRPSQLKQFKFAPPETGMNGARRKTRWLRLNTELISQQLPYPTLAVFLERTDQSEPYPKYHPREIIGPARHLNYAMQWAGFGTFALFLAGMLQMRTRSSTTETR